MGGSLEGFLRGCRRQGRTCAMCLRLKRFLRSQESLLAFADALATCISGASASGSKGCMMGALWRLWLGEGLPPARAEPGTSTGADAGGSP